MEKEEYVKESYQAYMDRIRGLVCIRACFPPEYECLATSSGLNQKFQESGTFRCFYGDTVVFLLPETMRHYLGNIRDSLYQVAGKILSDRLPEGSLHITLHDLSSAPVYQAIKTELGSHQQQIQGKLPYVKSRGILHLRAKGMVSMVSSSIVMLFEPAYEKDHDRIQDMYTCIEEVCHLPYPLTLHCTLAYYKPGMYSPKEWNGLYWFINQWNDQNKEGKLFAVDSGRIQYQFFRSMREYIDISV